MLGAPGERCYLADLALRGGNADGRVGGPWGDSRLRGPEENALADALSESVLRNKLSLWVASGLCGTGQIRKIYLVGSRARGDHSDASDLDLALEVDAQYRSTEERTYLGHRHAWKRELTALVGHGVDLLWYEEGSSSELQESLARDKVLLFDKADTQ